MAACLAFQLAAEKSLRSWSTRRSMPVAAETRCGFGGAQDPFGFSTLFFSGDGAMVSGLA